MSNISLTHAKKNMGLFKNISLLPPEIKVQRLMQRRRSLCLLGSSLAVMVLLCIYIVLTAVTMHVRAETRVLQEQRGALPGEALKYKQYADLQVKLKQTEKLAQQAWGTPPDYKVIMAGIGLYIPDGVWLTDFTASYMTNEKTAAQTAAKTAAVPASGNLVVQGWATSHREVASWLVDIRSVPGLTDIVCQYSSEEDLNGQPLVKFEINANVLPGVPYQLDIGRGKQ